MKDRVQAFARKLGRDFMAFTPGQKAVTVAAALAIIVGGYMFSTWASKPSYAPLFTNLASSDASAIVDKLNSAHKPYKLADGGTAILVPQKDVYTERLTMSSAGLPSSGQSGYSLLDKEGVTTSEFKQRVDYQRALEGELSNTISAINGVQAAQVHLAIPQQDVFNDNTQKTTAAVLLTTTPGATLSNDQVRSVVNLVSSSVPALAPDQVTVSDATGKVLSAAGTGITAAAGTASQTEATQAYQNQLSTQVQQMLDRVLGPGHSVVTVNALLNFDSSTETSHQYTYSSGVPPLSQSTTSETYNGNGAGSGGALGAGTPVATSTAGSGNGNYSKNSGTVDNPVGTIDKTTVAAPGSIRQLGISVVLDKSAASAANQAAVQKLVSSAVGLNAKRGDTLAIATMAFDTTAAKQAAAAAAAAKKAAAAAASKAQMMSMAKTGGAVILVIITIIITAIMSRRRRRNGDSAEMTQDDEIDLFLSGGGVPQHGGPHEPAMLQTPAPYTESADLAAQRHVVSEMAAEQPDDVARALRNWLNTKGS